MNCPACGANNRDGARFCRRCGIDMGQWVPATETAAAANGSALVVEERPTPEAPVASIEAGAEGGGAGAGLEEGEETPQAAPGLATEEPPPPATQEAGAEQEPVGAQAAPAGRAPEEAVAQEATPASGEPDLPPTAASDEALPEAEGPAPAEEQSLAEEGHLADVDHEVVGLWLEEAEPVQAVEVGTVLADRYQVVEALDVQREAVLYQAHDLVRCWQCGFEGNARGDAFCARCGAAQDRRTQVRLLQVRDDGSHLPGGGVVAERFLHEGQTFLLLAEAEPEPGEGTPPVRGIRLVVGQRSDAGRVRELDEDSLLALTMTTSYEARTGPVLGLFSVADGMGGHEGGEIASKMAIQVLAAQAVHTILLPTMAGESVLDEDITTLLRQATIAANDAIYLARQKRENDMGTTLTTVLVRDGRLFVAHVGDCRAYRWNSEGLQQLTTDHSVVASMIAEGRAAPEEIYSHPHRSVIYRCVGDRPTVEVDTDMLPLASGDRIIVCSDGLWEMIHNEGIEDVMMREADPQVACDLLVQHANMAGGEDNISVIVFQVETI